MIKCLQLFSFLFFCSVAYPQQNDFLSLKKRGRTIKNYFTGSPISFIHINGSLIEGTLERIYKDSIFLYNYDIRMTPTPWGTRFADTVDRYDLRYHFNEIAAIPKPGKSFEFVRNGTLFMIGGVGYAFLHTFNGIIQKKKIEPTTLAIAGGVALLGFTMKKLRKYYYPIGKRYTLSYITLATE